MVTMQQQRIKGGKSTHWPTTSVAAVEWEPHPPVGVSVDEPTGNDTFYQRLQQLWGQVLKLEDMGIIHDEFGKFTFAYRLAEAELQRLCSENASLQQTLHELTGNSAGLSYRHT